MAKSSIHIKPCNLSSVEMHNERSKEYLQSVLDSGRSLYFYQDLTCNNQHWINKYYKGKTCKDVYNDLVELYKAKKGQAPQTKERVRINKKTGAEIRIPGWNPVREGVINIKPDTQLGEFQPIVDWFADRGINVIRLDLHHDEGYNGPNGERKLNHHAHIVLDWVDRSTGSTIKLDKADMAEMQDIVAQSLKMERGVSKAITGRQHISSAIYREVAAMQYTAELNDKIKAQTAKLADLRAVFAQAVQSAEKTEKARENAQKDFEEYVMQLEQRSNELAQLYSDGITSVISEKIPQIIETAKYLDPANRKAYLELEDRRLTRSAEDLIEDIKHQDLLKTDLANSVPKPAIRRHLPPKKSKGRKL